MNSGLHFEPLPDSPAEKKHQVTAFGNTYIKSLHGNVLPAEAVGTLENILVAPRKKQPLEMRASQEKTTIPVAEVHEANMT